MGPRTLTDGLHMQQVAIGIDLGGTQVRAALVDEQGRILARAAEPTDALAGPDRVLAQICGLADGLLAASNPASVVGVGVSAPGPLDTVAGVATDIPTLSGFVDFPLKAELQKRFRFLSTSRMMLLPLPLVSGSSVSARGLITLSMSRSAPESAAALSRMVAWCAAARAWRLMSATCRSCRTASLALAATGVASRPMDPDRLLHDAPA